MKRPKLDMIDRIMIRDKTLIGAVLLIRHTFQQFFATLFRMKPGKNAKPPEVRAQLRFEKQFYSTIRTLNSLKDSVNDEIITHKYRAKKAIETRQDIDHHLRRLILRSQKLRS